MLVCVCQVFNAKATAIETGPTENLQGNFLTHNAMVLSQNSLNSNSNSKKMRGNANKRVPYTAFHPVASTPIGN